MILEYIDQSQAGYMYCHFQLHLANGCCLYLRSREIFLLSYLPTVSIRTAVGEFRISVALTRPHSIGSCIIRLGCCIIFHFILRSSGSRC